MTSQHDKPKRWRPRLSVRTLVIVATLVCLYAACWEATKRQGVHDVERSELLVDELFFEASAELPLIVGATVARVGSAPSRRIKAFRHYYFWFFGYVAKLPYERKIPTGDDISHYLDAATSIP
jgi:hypothetical protein